MTPLLQTPVENPHATIITLFMNAVEGTMTNKDRIWGLTTNSRETRRLLEYLPPKRATSRFDPTIIKFRVGRERVETYDHIVDRFLKDHEFREAGEASGEMMKEPHTIIEEWPSRLKLRPDQSGAQDEFDRRLREGVSGKERYVEWKRFHHGMF
ncbi:uncharacterized protein N7477_004884 [Penicillium maclennaniae]|uniref:uncharacterized protein n=1 Tax=Penicillium maclennaniae TaxID=1343394 RepID=UPI00253F677E|nr:uncharacterized protein N7477_004884 [Penicillium maclennaniae]KAJ5674950.1 hypothetical protein N7477_004884 [Penicillium maclennaniae]